MIFIHTFDVGFLGLYSAAYNTRVAANQLSAEAFANNYGKES